MCVGFDSTGAQYVCSACGGQKKASNLLELELQMGVSHHVGAKN